MYSISKEFAFEASHQLTGLPPEHKCSRLHGHSYKVVFVLEAPDLNGAGFVRDYADLDAVREYINGSLDHRHLNDVLGGNPTSERLAEHLYRRFERRFPELTEVGVSETASTWAVYRG